MLSDAVKKKFREALASKGQNDFAEEVIAAIDSNGSGPAAEVAAIGATSDLPASGASLSTSDAYSDAAVNAAIDAQVDALAAAVESRLDVLEAKVDEALAALKASGQMDS